MTEYYVSMRDSASRSDRETPLGLYQADTPERAAQAAAREWGLSSLPTDAFAAEPLHPGR